MFYIDLQYEKSVETAHKKADRFDLAKFTDYASSFHETLDSYLLQELRKLSVFGTIIVTAEEGRPDLIAYKIYGQTQLWWVIMHYNSLQNVDEVVSSKILNYPDLNELERLYYMLPGLVA